MLKHVQTIAENNVKVRVLKQFDCHILLHKLRDWEQLCHTQAFELETVDPTFARLFNPTIVRGEVDQSQDRSLALHFRLWHQAANHDVWKLFSCQELGRFLNIAEAPGGEHPWSWYCNKNHQTSMSWNCKLRKTDFQWPHPLRSMWKGILFCCRHNVCRFWLPGDLSSGCPANIRQERAREVGHIKSKSVRHHVRMNH